MRCELLHSPVHCLISHGTTIYRKDRKRVKNGRVLKCHAPDHLRFE